MTKNTDRTLSCFFVREFFWTYLENRLDKTRTLQLEDHLKECHDCSSLLEREKLSKNVLLDLAATAPTAEVIAFLKKEHHFWEDLSAKLRLTHSIETFKWLAQLSAVALALGVTVHFFPWLNLARSLQKTNREAQQEIVVKPTPTATPSAPDVPFIGPKLPTAEELKALKENPTAKAPPPQVVHATPENKQNDEETESETAENSQGHQAGFVWRGALKVSELTDDEAESITKEITDLGGRKAGQVALGWKRGKEFYYHFILPQENYEKLLNALNAEGLVKLTKERHSRIMRSGYMRIIMTVEQDEDETR